MRGLIIFKCLDDGFEKTIELTGRDKAEDSKRMTEFIELGQKYVDKRCYSLTVAFNKTADIEEVLKDLASKTVVKDGR